MIEFDFTKCGLKPEDLKVAEDLKKLALQKIEEERQSKKIGWWALPYDTTPFHSSASQFENLIVLGIGGSSQGLKALADVLLSPEQKKRLHILEGPDPRSVAEVMERVDLTTCCLNVISKSGNTIETLTLFDFFKKKVKKEQIIVTTEEGDGLLYKVAKKEGIAHLPISQGVSGRFSVFSAVGLFPLAFLGVDIQTLRAGAKKALENSSNAFQNGLIHFLLNRDHGKTISVMMPYADCLEQFGGWYSQLWAESLGKEGKGQTPLVVMGPQGQHSLAQLFLDGPRDKVVTLIKVASDATNPLGKLLHKECAATGEALWNAGCPVVTLTLPNLSPETLGELLMIYQIQTPFTGHLMGINPYDQPAVEQIKQRIPRA